MTKTKTLKIAVAFSLAMLLGTSLFASTGSVKNDKVGFKNYSVVNLIDHAEISVLSFPGG